MKTSGEVLREITFLETLRRSFSGFITNGGAKISAQIEVLRYDLRYNAICEAYADDDAVKQEALYANDWRNGESVDAPSDVWQAVLSNLAAKPRS